MSRSRLVLDMELSMQLLRRFFPERSSYDFIALFRRKLFELFWKELSG